MPANDVPGPLKLRGHGPLLQEPARLPLGSLSTRAGPSPIQPPAYGANSSSCSCRPRRSCRRTPTPSKRTGLLPRAKAALSSSW